MVMRTCMVVCRVRMARDPPCMVLSEFGSRGLANAGSSIAWRARAWVSCFVFLRWLWSAG